jgi:hypothetical protein
MSWPGEAATAHPTLPNVNIEIPRTKTRRWPKWSPKEPPTKIKDANSNA